MRPEFAVAACLLIAGAIGFGMGWPRSHDPDHRSKNGTTREAPARIATAADSRSFSLIDQTGRAVTEQSFHGQWLIVFFGFTNCPEICPLTLAKTAAALKVLGARGENVRVALITVDPERDTPEVLAKYLQPFGSRFVGLTGTTDQLAAANRVFRAYSQQQPGSADGAYDVQHSTHLYVLDPGGRFRRQISSDATAEELAATLSRTIAPT